MQTPSGSWCPLFKHNEVLMSLRIVSNTSLYLVQIICTIFTVVSSPEPTCFCSTQSETLKPENSDQLISLYKQLNVRCHSFEYFFTTKYEIVRWTSHMKDFLVQIKFLLFLVNKKSFSWSENPRGIHSVSTWHPIRF